MSHIVLLACVSKKLARSARAEDLYRSPLFRKSLAYARILQPDHIVILSAKHGVIDLEETIEPYDETLNRMAAHQVRAWSERVLDQLRSRFDLDSDRFTVLAGDRYRSHILPHVRHADVPMMGLGIGKQLQFLAHALSGP